MKLLLSTLAALAIFTANAQRSEDLIPQEAVSVFSINNINLLQKVSLDELVQYEFMEEIEQEIFDGSTSGKTIKDAGIDFDQKLNIFQGSNWDYQITGMTFGISNKQDFFTVFDDFEPIESNYEDVEFYASYFNRIAIKGNSGILFRVNPLSNEVSEITDSIWYARGNEYPWYYDNYYDGYDEEYYEEEYYDEHEVIESEFFKEMETEENTTTPIDEADNLPEADADPTTKTYFELLDSVELALHNKYLYSICEDIFIDGKTLVASSPEFRKELESDSEGTFYLDNTKNMQKELNSPFLMDYYPILSRRLEGLYDGSSVVGQIHINETSIDLDIETRYSEEIGEIYKKLTDSKFDKNVAKYIPADNQSFFTYNVNLREAYEEAFELMMPIYKDSENRMISTGALVYDLMNDFVNKDALFDAYKGSMFGSFNGIQKIKTTKIIWDYDDETFEYTEQEVEAFEDMPIFVLGFSTERHDVAKKIMDFMAKHEREVTNMGDYYIIENAIFNSVNAYIINKNGLFIYTNDENLVKNNSNGYGNESIAKKDLKKAMKSGAVYARADLSKTVAELPKEIFSNRDNKMIDVLRGKSGMVELTSSKSTATSTSLSLNYEFEGEYENSGTYILDLINSLYVISK